MNGESASPVIAISPEPTPEERAAIVAAVTTALRHLQPAPEPVAPAPSRWARRGRLDAMRGLNRDD